MARRHVYHAAVHLEQLPSGAWRVTVQYRGQRRRATAPDRDRARIRGAELMAELGSVPRSGDVTVGELVDARLAAGTTLAASSRDDYLRLAARLRADAAGFVAGRVRDVEPIHFEHLYRNLARSGWSPWRVAKLHDLLGSSFSHAVRWGWVRHNPTHGVAPAVPPAPDVHPPSDTEVRRILRAATGQIGLAVRLAATLGMRRGEIVALQWADIDLRRATLRVRRSLSYTPETGVVEGDTKTRRKGHRTLALRAPLPALLKAHQADQAAKALAAGLGAPVWVLSHDAGVTPWRPDYLTHEFEALPGRTCRLHDLRHYCATTLLMAGVPVKVVSQMLGHATTETTERVYAHWIPGSDSAAADIMSQRLG